VEGYEWPQKSSEEVAIMEVKLTTSDVLGNRNTSSDNIVSEFLHSAAFSALQAPTNGAAELVDKSCGTNLLPNVSLIERPQETRAFGSAWHAQQLGSIIGTTLPFLLLHKGVGTCGNAIFGKIEQSASSKLLANRVIAESMITGAMFEGTFRQSASDQLKDKGIFQSRFNQAVVGAATFGTLTGSSLGVQSALRAERGIVGAALRSEIVSTMLSGIPAGVVNAELTSRLSSGEHATGHHLFESIYSFSVLGGAIAVGKRLGGRTHAEANLSTRMSEYSRQARESGAPTLSERISGTLHEIVSSISDRTIPPGAQPLAVEGIGAVTKSSAVEPTRRSPLADAHAVYMAARPEGIPPEAFAVETRVTRDGQVRRFSDGSICNADNFGNSRTFGPDGATVVSRSDGTVIRFPSTREATAGVRIENAKQNWQVWELLRPTSNVDVFRAVASLSANSRVTEIRRGVDVSSARDGSPVLMETAIMFKFGRDGSILLTKPPIPNTLDLESNLPGAGGRIRFHMDGSVSIYDNGAALSKYLPELFTPQIRHVNGATITDLPITDARFRVMQAGDACLTQRRGGSSDLVHTLRPEGITEIELSLLGDIAKNRKVQIRQQIYRDFLQDYGRSGEVEVWSAAMALPKSRLTLTFDPAVIEIANALKKRPSKKTKE
jgi:hypothetical protein